MPREEGDTVVRGYVSLPSDRLPAVAKQVTIVVEDVSRADVPSRVVAEQRLGRVELHPADRIEFAVRVPSGAIDPRCRYAVRVHVDVAGSGSIHVGDLVSTQSHPVLTFGAGSSANVQVKPVG